MHPLIDIIGKRSPEKVINPGRSSAIPPHTTTVSLLQWLKLAFLTTTPTIPIKGMITT